MIDSQKTDWREAAAAEYLEKRGRLADQMAAHQEQIARLRNKIDACEKALAELDAAARAFNLPIGQDFFLEPPPQPEASPGRSGPQFKVLALNLLREQHPKPMRAADIQAQVEAAAGRKFHEKTAGMTLYRLSLDGLVRRDGFDWYYVPEEERPEPLAQIARRIAEIEKREEEGQDK